MRNFTPLFPLLLAAGCTAPNPGLAASSLAALDRASVVTTRGAHSMSQLAIESQGTLDPSGRPLTLEVRDARLKIERTDDGRVLVESIALALADVDLPSSAALPHGLALRGQELADVGVVRGDILADGPDLLVVRAPTALRYRTSTLLPDGAPYQLGDTVTRAAPFDVRIAREDDGRVTVTLDGTADSTQPCWSVPGVISATDCVLYVESDGAIALPPRDAVFE
jgi:hypothetical protein